MNGNRLVVVSLMASIAIRRRAGILPAHMTEIASRAHVRSGQGETGLRTVIEG
jgi:hypothetical protein